MPPRIVEQIELLNEQAWKIKKRDTKRALELAMEARHLAEAHSDDHGLAYSLRNSSYCQHLTGNYQAGLLEATEALTLFEKLHDKPGMASALNCAGKIYDALGEYSKAVEFCTRSLRTFEKLYDEPGTLKSCNNLGNIYFHLGDYAKALDFYRLSVRTKTGFSASEHQHRALSNIGGVYQQLGQFEKACEHYLEALQRSQEIEDTDCESACLANLGAVHTIMGNYECALEYLLRGVDVSQKNDNKYPRGWTFIYLGRLHKVKNESAEALEAFQIGLEIAQQIGDRVMQGEALIGLGELFREQEDCARELESFSKALGIAEEIGNNDHIFRVHNALSQIYERQRDFSLALSHYKQFYEVRQKLFGEEADRKLQAVMIQAEVEKAQKEAEIYRLKHVELAARVRELEDTARELQDVNRRQGDFVSGVSHGLKTPLTLIRLYGETLLHGKGFSEEVRDDYYQIITRESERLTHLVNNVLDFSRINRGLKEYAFQEGDIASAVSETVAISEQHLRRAGFTVYANLASDLPPVQFDPTALSEVVLNLLDNASKYCGDQKQIWVNLRSDISNVVLEVEDHGVGIAGSEHERIFEQFYRSPNSTAKGGYGLGLFLVKHVMDAHGGMVEVKSEAGHGSLFRLRFPIKPTRLDKGTASAQ